MSKKGTGFTIDSDVLAKVRALAEWDGRNLSEYINLVLEQHLIEKGVRPPDGQG